MMTEIGGIMNFLMVIGDLWGFWPSKMGMCVCVSVYDPMRSHDEAYARIIPDACMRAFEHS